MAKQVEQTKPPHPMIALRGFLDARINEIRTALPNHISPERFMRVVLTAVQINTELLACDRQSLWNACMRAANDGLLPDGREGAIVAFKSRANWLVMYPGLIKKFYNTGDFQWIAAYVVYENEKFTHHITQDGEEWEHIPSDDHAGKKVRLVYAAATTKSGGKFLAVLTLAEVKKHENLSRTTRDDAPWKQHWEAMARKTAIRELAKLLPMSSDVDALLRRDEEARLGVEAVEDSREATADRQDTKSVLDQFAGYPTRVTAHEWPEDGMPIPVKKDESSAPDDFPGDEPPLKPGEVEIETDREQSLQREPPATKPENAEQYRAYYEAKRASVADDLSQAQLLRGWFHGDAERRLRSKCQVPIEEINQMKQDLEDHLRALNEGTQHD